MVLYAAGFLVFLTLMVYLLRPSKKELPEMEVKFEDLAQLWLPYNEKIEPAPTDDTVDVGEELFGTEGDSLTQDTPEVEEPTKKEETATQKETETTKTEEKLPTKTSKPTKKADNTVPPTLSNEFWKDCIAPYMDTIKEQGVLEVIKSLVDLLEKHGHHPSVVTDNNDTEAVELLTVRDNLSNITLKEHSYQVARIMINLVKDAYKEYQPLMPKTIITSIAHDIGKIPEFRLSGMYNTAEHPLVSANKLTELFTGLDIFWSKHAIQAVREHHHKSKDQWTNLLKQADRQARQAELVRFTENFTIKKFEDWFNVGAFLKKLEKHVNVTQTNKWQAFSCNGIIYCKTQLIYDIAKKMAKEAKALDLTLIYESEKESVFRQVVKALKGANLIPDYIGENQYGRQFEIKTSVPSPKKYKFFLTPIKMDDRFDLAEIEKRKQGFTEIIKDVVIV